jgi:hypothetical protein
VIGVLSPSVRTQAALDAALGSAGAHGGSQRAHARRHRTPRTRPHDR